MSARAAGNSPGRTGYINERGLANLVTNFEIGKIFKEIKIKTGQIHYLLINLLVHQLTPPI